MSDTSRVINDDVALYSPIAVTFISTLPPPLVERTTIIAVFSPLANNSRSISTTIVAVLPYPSISLSGSAESHIQSPVSTLYAKSEYPVFTILKDNVTRFSPKSKRVLSAVNAAGIRSINKCAIVGSPNFTVMSSLADS